MFKKSKLGLAESVDAIVDRLEAGENPEEILLGSEQSVSDNHVVGCRFMAANSLP